MTTALMTDMYEYTMLDALVHAEKADNPATFELFARKLPEGRRYGIVGGIGRFLDAYENFRIDAGTIDHLIDYNIITPRTAQWLRDFRFTLTIDAYPEGQTYYPYSPIMTVSGRLGECILLETLALSILNADSAVASAAARMVVAAQGRPIIEMGSRRTHNDAAISAARTAYIQGFAATSNLEAGARYNIPTTGTAAHAFTLAFPTEREAFRAQVAAHGPGTTLLVDTYDIEEGIRTAIDVAGTDLGAIRIDSGDLGDESFKARELLDGLGAVNTGIVISSDIDEYSITALQGAPIDGYGAGTRVVTGSGHPTAGMVYKLVEIADTLTGPSRPVAKASAGKPSVGGKKIAYRDREGHEFYQFGGTVPEGCTAVAATVVEEGRVVCRTDIEQTRAFAAQVLQNLPGAARPISHGAAYTTATERKKLVKALIVVDVQNDFVEGGALGCAGGRAVAESIAELIRDSSYDLVVFSLDWHNPETNNDGHFSSTPDYLNTWPRHCEAGTHGAETVAALADVPDVTFVRKGFDAEAYSAFEGADHTGRSLAKILADADIDSVDVVGIAFAYCVRETALDAADIGLDTTVLHTYCASVQPAIDHLTTRALQSGGVTVI